METQSSAEIKVDPFNEHYVIPYNNQFSVMGFEYVFSWCKELTKAFQKEGLLSATDLMAHVDETHIGTLSMYEQYKHLCKLASSSKKKTFYFNYKTKQDVRRALKRCYDEGTKVRLFYGEENGRSWLDEYDMVGVVQSSTGPLRIPILDGSGILDARVIRIIDVATNEDIYVHKNFHCPTMEIRATTDSELLKNNLSHGVWVNIDQQGFVNSANFESYGKAAHWVAFMHGESNRQPS